MKIKIIPACEGAGRPQSPAKNKDTFTNLYHDGKQKKFIPLNQQKDESFFQLKTVSIKLHESPYWNADILSIRKYDKEYRLQ